MKKVKRSFAVDQMALTASWPLLLHLYLHFMFNVTFDDIGACTHNRLQRTYLELRTTFFALGLETNQVRLKACFKRGQRWRSQR